MHVLVMVVMRSALERATLITRALEQQRCATHVAPSSTIDLAEVRRRAPSAILVEVPSGDEADRLALVERLHADDRARPIVVLAGHGSEGLSTAAFRAGAADYFSAPYDADAIARAVARHAQPYVARGARAAADGEADLLLGDSEPMQTARGLLRRIAARNVNVLITGETGTGKELAARFVHAMSGRRDRRLVAINCAAIPEALLESELFGYERGAFTGAATRRVGYLQSADGGTVFLDEVGDLGLAAQAKVLRALESREISPLGGARPVGVDIRVVAATNHDLERAVEEGRFRRDLYFRLNVARVQLPPLRARRSDVHLLVAHYVAEQNQRFGARVIGLSRDVEAALAAYDWPGNVRELRNLVESACLQRDAGEIGFDDLPLLLRQRLAACARAQPSDRELLIDALAATHWNVTRAAARLQWSRMTIYRKMAKYRLTKSARPSTVTP
jgi:DNA-binding NtrC family response regulator